MKKIIRKILNEETSKKIKLKSLIDELGWERAAEVVGGFSNLVKALYNGDVKQYWIDRVRSIINYQTEIQDPENFNDAEEYADSCISEGIEFIREWYHEEWDHKENPDVNEFNEDDIEDIENKMNDEFFDELKDLYNEIS